MPIRRGTQSIKLYRRPVVAVGSGLDAATTAWVNAVVAAGGSVSAGRQTAVNTFITALKSASLWTTLDRYWLLAGEDLPSARVSLVNPSNLLTQTGTPTLAADGITTSSGNVLTGFTPSTDGVNFTQNSATFGGYIKTDRTTAALTYEFAAANGAFTNICSFVGYNTGSYAEIRINGGSAFGQDKTHGTKGSWVITRTSSTNVAAYYNNNSTGFPNGGDVQTTNNSSGLPDVPFAIGALNQGGSLSNYSGDKISSFFVASGWNSTQVGNFYSAEQALLTSIGVLP